MPDTIGDILERARRRREGGGGTTIGDVLAKRRAESFATSPEAAAFVGGAPTSADEKPLPEWKPETPPAETLANMREAQALQYLRQADAAQSRRGTTPSFADNPEFQKAFQGPDGRLDPEKTAAYLETVRRSHAEALPPAMALAAHLGRTVAGGTTLGFWKGGLTDAEDRLVSENPAVQGPIGAVVGAGGTVLAAANPVGPTAMLTRGASMAGAPAALANPLGFGLATGIEHRSPAAGIEAAAFSLGAGAGGRLLAGEGAGALRRGAAEALGAAATGAALSKVKGEEIDWPSLLATSGLFGALGAARKSPLTRADWATLKRAEAIGVKVPEATPEQIVAYLKGSSEDIPAETFIKIGVADAPALAEHRAEVARAELPPDEELAIRKANAGKKIDEVKAALAKARKPVDVTSPLNPDEIGVSPTTRPIVAPAEPVALNPEGTGVRPAEREIGARPEPLPETPVLPPTTVAPIPVAPPVEVAPPVPSARREEDPTAPLPEAKPVGAEPAPSEPPASARPEAPVPEAAPVPERAPASAGARTRAPRGAKPKSLAQLVRSLGGFHPDRAGAFSGELDMLRQKDSGSSRLVTKRGRSPDELMQAAREAGFDIPADLNGGDFMGRVLDDVRSGGRDLSAQTADADRQAEKAFRYEAAAQGDRLAEAEAADAAAEREAMQAEGEGDTSFDVFGDRPGRKTPGVGDVASGKTREGETVTGKVARETGASLVLEDGSRIPKKGAILGDNGNSRLPLSTEPRPEHANQEPMGPNEVVDALSEIVDAPIRSGRMTSRRPARGEYKTGEKVIRVRESYNIPTVSHEVGHALSDEVALKSNAPRVVKKELVQLGKDLYGSTKPAAGYAEEGVGELVRLWVTDPAEAARRAPKATAWLDDFLKTDAGKDYAGPMAKARAAVARFAGQGTNARNDGGMVLGRAGPSKWAQFKDFLSARNWVDSFDPAKKFTEMATELEGKAPEPSKDPYAVLTAARMAGSAKVREWVDGQGVTDISGTIIGPSLSEGLAPAEKVDPGLKRFRAYLWAKHAIDVHDRGMNPGMPREDAEWTVAHAGPEFQLAADKFYEWRRNVLRSAMGPGNIFTEAQVQKWLDRWPHSVPLERVFDEPRSMLRRGGFTSGIDPVYRLKGSGRRVRDPLAVSIEQALRIQRANDRYRFLRAVASHAVDQGGKSGMGGLIEKVPTEQVKRIVSIEKLKKQLEEAGADLSDADLESKIEYFANKDQPSGRDPVFPIRDDAGKETWYHVQPEMWDMMKGLDVYRLPKALDVTFGTLKRILVTTTTGLRPAFGAVRNPARDLPTFLMQSSADPVTAAAAYARAAAEVARKAVGKGDHAYADLFDRLGVGMAQPLAADTLPVRTAAAALGKSKTWKVVHSPVEALRELLQVTEKIPRIAEMKIVADRLGWDGKRPLTENEAILITNAGKRITTDFSAGGHYGQVINALSAFFNPAIQGVRTAGRAARANPKGTILRGLATITAPTLALWWLNKDEKWYKDMPERERFAYAHIAIGDQDIRFPRPYEWGNAFSVLPEALADWAYRQNPESMKAALDTILNNTVPDPLNNPAFKVPWEEHGNRVGYTGIPIESESDKNLPAEERVGPNTTGVAKAIGSVTGRLFGYSPKMVDHAIKGFFGGLGGDVAALTGTGAKARDFEPADIPVVGTVFKRGGKEGGNSKAVESVYAKAKEAVERGNSKETPESSGETMNRERLVRATAVLTMLSRALPLAKSTSQAKKLSSWRRDIAIAVDEGKEAPAAKDVKQFLQDAGLIRPK